MADTAYVPRLRAEYEDDDDPEDDATELALNFCHVTVTRAPTGTRG